MTGSIGPKPNPRPLILHVDSDTNIPYRLAESDSLYIGSLSANDYSNLNISGIGGFPSQSGNNGKYLTTNGTSLSWDSVTGASNFNIITKSANGTPLNGDGTAKTDVDADLLFVMEPNSKYLARYNLFIYTSATGTHQFKFGFLPTDTNCSATWSLIAVTPTEGNAPQCGTYTVTGLSGYYTLGSTNGNSNISLQSIFNNDGNTNVIYLDYGVGSSSNIEIKTGSYLEYKKL